MHYYRFQTRRGPIFIVPKFERWAIIYKDEDMGNYHSPQAAASDAHMGALPSASDGNMFNDYEIPEDLGEWTLLRRSF